MYRMLVDIVKEDLRIRGDRMEMSQFKAKRGGSGRSRRIAIPLLCDRHVKLCEEVEQRQGDHEGREVVTSVIEVKRRVKTMPNRRAHLYPIPSPSSPRVHLRLATTFKDILSKSCFCNLPIVCERP